MLSGREAPELLLPYVAMAPGLYLYCFSVRIGLLVLLRGIHSFSSRNADELLIPTISNNGSQKSLARTARNARIARITPNAPEINSVTAHEPYSADTT